MADTLELTDEEVARRVQSGDAEAFGLLMERYEPKMSRYARKFLFGNDDVTDLVQEVFIKAYTNIQSFDTSRRFSPWIYQIAHNEYINALKQKGRDPISFFDNFDFDSVLPHPAAQEAADTEASERETRAMLDDGLAKLNPKYREVLVLFYYEELDYGEMAELLHVPISTVGVRLRRAREKLKEVISNHE